MAGFDFSVVVPEVDEERTAGEPPEEYVCRVAEDKARAVAARVAPGTLVLGLDTCVALGDRLFGKPANEDAAVDMLLELAGATHTVYTGYALAIAGTDDLQRGVDAARVTMRSVSIDEARAYAASGEPLDKAGAYALQGEGGGFVDEVEGLRSTVIGLPLEHVVDLLVRNGSVLMERD
jgi:septum formation protein